MPVSDGVITLILERIAEQGLFALLFFLLLGWIIYKDWKSKQKQEEMLEKRDLTSEKHFNTIVETNSQSVKAFEKISDLMEILTKQTEATAEQLTFIKKNMQKQNMAATELVNVLKVLVKDNQELSFRMDSVIKEIQRPID